MSPRGCLPAWESAPRGAPAHDQAAVRMRGPGPPGGGAGPSSPPRVGKDQGRRTALAGEVCNTAASYRGRHETRDFLHRYPGLALPSPGRLSWPHAPVHRPGQRPLLDYRDALLRPRRRRRHGLAVAAHPPLLHIHSYSTKESGGCYQQNTPRILAGVFLLRG